MASSSHSTPFAAPHPGPLSVELYRDPAGFLPLVPCNKCGTKLIGRMSQKAGSKGKRFYKCPLLEHTDFACGTYMFEEQYVEYLVAKGHLPRGCSQIRGRDGMVVEVFHAGSNMVKASPGVEACHDLLQLKDSEAMLKSLLDSHTTLCNKIEKIGERLLVVAAAKLVEKHGSSTCTSSSCSWIPCSTLCTLWIGLAVRSCNFKLVKHCILPDSHLKCVPILKYDTKSYSRVL